MLTVNLIDEDSKIPNLALMKLSAWHQGRGDRVLFNQIEVASDIVYASKVFTYTERRFLYEGNTLLGGTGFESDLTLSDEVEHTCPDYLLYGEDYSMGFLTRGCFRCCPWCFVPEKEGELKAHASIEEFLRHEKVVLLDNNVLGCDHGIEQIERLGALGVKVDFNQGLDARLIDDAIARRLSKIKWDPCVRLACDSPSSMEPLHKAVRLLRWHNVHPRRYRVYVLVKDVDEAMERVKFVKGLYLDPFAQPFRDKEGTEPTEEQKDFARWVNHPAVFNSVSWEEYRKRAEK